MWADLNQYFYEDGALFLGQLNGQELGIKTERHAITIAGAGAGKGACVIIPNLKKWPASTLVIDPKGEAAEATSEDRAAMGQNVHVVDPFSSANVNDNFKSSYNPLDEIDVNSMTIKEDIESISDGIVMRADATASHWDDGAQAVISGLIAYTLLALPKEDQHLISVREILRNIDLFQEVATEMKSLDGCNGLCESGAAAIFAKEGEYFVSNAEKNTRWLDSEGMKNALTKSNFSLSELKSKQTSIYLVLPANYLGQHGRFLRLFVRCAIERMAHKTPEGKLRDNQCLFILDEFFSLGYIDEISKAAGLMRGYGLQLWPILQDLGQLIKLYGNEGSETFFGNADLHQFFGNTDRMTLEYMSFMTGHVTVAEIGDAPKAPVQAQGQSLIGAMSAHSKDGATRATGALFGALSQNLDSLGNAWAAADHQNEMNEYQQKMSTLGKPRYSVEELAKMVQRKNDVIADNMFCVAHGADKILVKPAPYFRDLVAPPKPEKKNRNPMQSKNPFVTLLAGVGLGGFVGVSMSQEMTDVKPIGVALAMGFVGGIIGFLIGLFRRHRAAKKSTAPNQNGYVHTSSNEAILVHLKKGNEIMAIKEYRAATGCDYKTARAAISELKS